MGSDPRLLSRLQCPWVACSSRLPEEVELSVGCLLDEKSGLVSIRNVQSSGVMPSAPPAPSAFLCALQVLVQGCLLDPSQREAFLQQVYEQLCLFEDKVATMLQQQYEPQGQVSGKEGEQRPFRGQLRAGGTLSQGCCALHSQGRLPAGHGSSDPTPAPQVDTESMKAFACEFFVCLFCLFRFYFSSPGIESKLRQF